MHTTALLEHALATERASEGVQAAKAQAAARETRTYQQYLREQMAKDAESEEAINRARLAMEQRVWDERDAARRRQEEARAAMLQQVRADNEAQLRCKSLARVEAAKQEAEQLEQWAAEQTQALAQEQEAVRREAAAAEAHEAALREQVAERRARALLEEQREYLQRKHMIKAEAEHKARLQAQAGRVRLSHPLSSSGVSFMSS